MEAEEAAKVHPDDFPPLMAPTEVFVEVLRVAVGIRAVKPWQEPLIVGLVFDGKADELRDRAVVFSLATDHAVGVTDDLVLFGLLEHLRLEGRIDLACDGQPVEVEAAVEVEVVLQMPQLSDPFGQPFAVPTLKRFRPHTHLHQRHPVDRLEPHVPKKPFSLSHLRVPTAA